MVDYLDPERIGSVKQHFDILELLSEGLNIYTDSAKEKIEENRTNPYINYLIKNSRIKSASDEFRLLRTDYERNIPNIGNSAVTVYMLDELVEPLKNKLMAASGFHVFTAGSNHMELFQEDIETFKKSTTKYWSFAKRFLSPHNAIVIADPFLFKDHTRKSVLAAFEQVVPVGLQKEYYVTLIGSDQSRKSELPSKTIIEKWTNDLLDFLVRKEIKAKVEFHIYNKEEFHDRYIITNNIFIYSGYGMDILKNGNNVQKDGIWIAHKPFKHVNVNGSKGVLFYKVMKEKLGVLNSFIQGSVNNSITTNPLFHLDA